MEKTGAAAPAVVVTGVSSGIGNGTTRVLLAHGYRVFGSVRKQDVAARLSAELGAMFTPLVFDVTDAEAVRRGAEVVRRALGGEKLAGLVNNAGIAVPGPLLEMPVSDLRHQLEVNLVSVLTVTQAFFPLLRKRGETPGPPARIVNISSPAGKFALPFLGPYAASKHGVEGLSDGLRRELLLYGVDVIVVDPGSVATAIWDKADAIDMAPYKSSPYLPSITRFKSMMLSTGRSGAPPEKPGALVLEALSARKPRARYHLASRNPMMRLARSVLSTRSVDRMVGKNLGLLGN